MQSGERYAFGNFVIEPAQQRVLRADGTTLALTPRLFNALWLFVQQPGQLIEKDLLMQALWPGLVVEENNLSQVISGLRRALGDDPQGSRFIQTVPRRGFRFLAPVTLLPPLLPASAVSVRPAAPADAAPERPLELAPARRRRIMRVGSAVAAVVATGGWAWWWRSARPQAAGVTVAVLPFKPLSLDGRDDLLEIGMADSLVVRLSAVPGLVVRSTGSVLGYAGPTQDPLRAARELDVQWIVDGSLQRRGDRLRASARLLRAADGQAAWSGSFDEQYANVFDIQDQISARVTAALAQMLSPGSLGNAHLVELGGTRSTEAYQLYVAAAWRSQDMRDNSAQRAITLLQQALAIDPSYALAWVMLAWVHRRRLWRNDARPADVAMEAEAAVRRALALAPQLAQARAALGHNLYFLAFDWPGAERELRAALAANTSDESAHFGLALTLFTQGHVDEGLRHMRQACQLDPMSPVLLTIEGSLLLDHGDLAAARARLSRALDIAPQHGLAHLALGMLLAAEQQHDQATDVLRRAAALHDGSARPRAVLASHLAQRGRTDEAQALLAELVERSRQRYVPPTSLAMVLLALGRIDEALDALEQAVAVRDNKLTFLKDERQWVALRALPRFKALLVRLRMDRFGPGLAPV